MKQQHKLIKFMLHMKKRLPMKTTVIAVHVRNHFWGVELVAVMWETYGMRFGWDFGGKRLAAMQNVEVFGPSNDSKQQWLLKSNRCSYNFNNLPNSWRCCVAATISAKGIVVVVVMRYVVDTKILCSVEKLNHSILRLFKYTKRCT